MSKIILQHKHSQIESILCEDDLIQGVIGVLFMNATDRATGFDGTTVYELHSLESLVVDYKFPETSNVVAWLVKHKSDLKIETY